MRNCPEWFQAALTRIGGVNQYGEPIFKLVWSTGEQMTVGGKWAQTGYVGYKRTWLIPGDPCWALLVWEPAEVSGGSMESWNRDYRDEETGLLQCGGYPKYGAYRVLQKFIHREIVQQAKERHYMDGPRIRREIVARQKLRTYRMEPCGFMLDIMLPMLMAWRRLSNAQKVAALRQQEQMRKDGYTKQAKDLRDSVKLSRVMRGSQLVQRRAEIVERGMRQAMAAAAQWGLGMRMES
jgi:hypothetical protein